MTLLSGENPDRFFEPMSRCWNHALITLSALKRVADLDSFLAAVSYMESPAFTLNQTQTISDNLARSECLYQPQLSFDSR